MREDFIRLYNSHYHGVKEYALRFCASKQNAEDIAQTIFMKLWEKRAIIHTIESPDKYLFIMAKNEFLLEKRFVKRKTKSLAQYHRLIDQTVFYPESKMMLDEGIKKLSPRMKTAISLRQEGYKIKEIALLMNIHPFTAKNHVIKALGKMKVFLN